MGMFHRNQQASNGPQQHDIELTSPAAAHTTAGRTERSHLPQYNHNGHRVTKGIQPDGESGRKGIHALHFPRICFRSSSVASKWCNIFWPVVPAAIAIHFARPELHLWVFGLNYVAMIPTANLVGFAGQELARKLPKVLGVLLETLLGSVVEIVLFMVLLAKSKNDDLIPVIQAAILGSILANMLLCLGLCFFVGGLKRKESAFDESISETGSGLMLVAGFGLLIPSAFFKALDGSPTITQSVLRERVLTISRAAAIILLAAFLIYVWFQTRTHHGVYDTVFKEDEAKDEDRHHDLTKDKLTLTECVIALLIALVCVSFHAVFLVEGIPYIVRAEHVSDMFMGLILVPLVEKFAEHLTAIDEAWDNQMNFALVHVLGATIQTALLNAPLVVLVGWGIGKEMSLDFEIFMTVVFFLAILVVGTFLRDLKSNYLEGALCVLVYLVIAVTAWYYPNPLHGNTNDAEGGGNHKM